MSARRTLARALGLAALAMAAKVLRKRWHEGEARKAQARAKLAMNEAAAHLDCASRHSAAACALADALSGVPPDPF